MLTVVIRRRESLYLSQAKIMVAENASNSLYLQDPLSLEISNLRNSNGLNAESYRATSSFQSASSLENLSPISSSPVAVSSQLPFTSGIFTVGSTGQVGVDYLFDGGIYQGELAIFSLQGLESLGLDTPEFIKEVGRRALSDSTLGHVVISDQIDGARFSGALPWEGDFNAGDYLGVRTFAMRPGDTFGVMLVADGTVQQVFETPTVEGALHPLFSLVGANPNGAFQFGQIADVDGNGHTFTMEDLRLDGESDRDYNDIIFQVRGATGSAVKLDSVIDTNHDWRKTDLGQDLMRFIQPPKNQPLIGLIDTGVSPNPDLDLYNIHFGPGSDYVAGDGNPILQPGEGNQHGTYIAGIIGATRNNEIGINGINDQAPLYVERAVGSGKWAQALVNFVDASKEMGQPHAIANLSFDLTQLNRDGTTTTRYEFTPEERKALEYARQKGVLIVAASGNDGGTMSALGQASQEFDNIITVGAIDYNGKRADYSSFGYGLDIVAYGGTIAQPIMSTVGSGVDLPQWMTDVNSQLNQLFGPLQDQTTGIADGTTQTNNFSTWNLQSDGFSANNPTDQFPGNQSSFGNQIFDAIDEKLPDDEMAKNVRHVFEDVFGSTTSVDESELGTFTPEERQAYDEATKEVDQLLNEYLAEASQKLALEYVDGYYGIQVDALSQFVDAFDENVGQNLIQAQEILKKEGYEIQIPSVSTPSDLGVGWMAGTSVATAQVTGIASQAWASNPDLNYLQIKNILKQTATDLSTPGWDVETGAGAVNLGKAVELAKKTKPEIYQPLPILSPLTWTGENTIFPGERPVWESVPSFSGNVMNIGDVTLIGYQRIRSGPGTGFPEVGTKSPGESITFDAYENNGSRYTDTVLGTSSTRWYRIAGTNNWMWSGFIDNNPEQAEQNRQAQTAIAQANENQRLADEKVKQALEDVRLANEALEKIKADQERQREVFQAVVNEITQKYGNPGLLLGSRVSNGVTIYQFAKGQLFVQPDGRNSFYGNSSKFKKHITYEKLTKEDIYDYAQGKKDLKDLFKGYDPNKSRVFYDDRTALVAVGLVPYNSLENPVLVFEGTDPSTDSLPISDTNPIGIGAEQFSAAKRLGIEDWLKTNSNAERKVDITGHSLGGALAQMTGAEFPQYVNEVVTFNSPGIGLPWLSKVVSSKVAATHYMVEFDPVSSGGLLFLPGDVFMISTPDLNKHLRSGLLEDSQKSDSGVKMRQIPEADLYLNQARPGVELIRTVLGIGPNLVKTVGGALADGIINGINTVGSFTSSVLETIKRNAEEAKQKAQDLADTAKAIYQTATAIVQQAKAAYQTLKQEIDKRTTQIVQQSQQKVKEMAQSIAQKVMQNPVVQTASKVFNQVANYASKAVQTVSNIINSAQQIVSNVVETGKQIINNVIQTGKQAYETVSNFVSSAVNQGTQIATATYNNAAQAVNNVTNVISGGFNGVKSLFGW